MSASVVPCDEVRHAIRSEAQLVDVRSEQEFAQGALPGAMNLPVQTLLVEHDELDPTRQVFVYCASGQRGEIARVYLKKNGFADVINLGRLSAYNDC